MIIFFLLILVGISVESLTRTLTDSSDTMDRFIRNSNGKYWDVTASNIQVAINDLEMNILYESQGRGSAWNCVAPREHDNYYFFNYLS